MKVMLISNFLVCWLLLLPAGLLAQESDFLRTARDVAADLEKAKQEKVRIEADIAQEKAAWQTRMRDLSERLEQQKIALAADEADLEAMRCRRDDLSLEIQTHTANMQTLAAAVREFAENFLGLAERSPYTAETPARLTALKGLLKDGRFPGFANIRTLVDLAFQDMAASSQIFRRTGEYIDRRGRPVTGDICRLGHLQALFVAGGEAGYLYPSPASGRLMAAAPPGWIIQKNIGQYLNGETTGVYMDVSGGAALKQLARRVTVWEQLQSGGFLVWPILLVGVVAAVLIVERLFFLARVRQNTDVLMNAVTGLVDAGDFGGALAAADTQPGRPTANVIRAGLGVQDEPRDIIESSLSEAILKETPRLERFLPALKVLAAIAPLLGLLGTVTGMINTFKVITIHGTGDPRLMAGGISEALVTTQLGLAAAIPIMMMAALLGRKAQAIAADMEEKAMAMMAALLRRQRNGR